LDRLKDVEGLEDAGGSQRLKDLKKQVETLKEEVFKAETGTLSKLQNTDLYVNAYIF
jgi:hypothetical protein